MKDLKDKVLTPLLILGAILVIWLLVWAVRQPSFQQSLNYYTEGVFGDDPNIVELDPVQVEREAEAVVTAIESRDPANCATLADPSQVTNCEQNILRIQALESDSPAACAKLSGEKNQAACKAEVLYTQAILEDSPAKCEQIELADWQATCLDRFRLEVNN